MTLSRKNIFFALLGFAILVDFIVTLVTKTQGYHIRSLLGLAFILLDLSGIYFELKKECAARRAAKLSVKNFRLNVSFSGAIYGGFTGGVLSGVILLVCWCNLTNMSFSQCSMIILCCATAGCIICGFVYAGRKLLSFTFLSPGWIQFIGCFAGCVIGSSFSALLCLYVFEQNQSRQFLTYDKIISGSIMALPGIIPGILAYNYDGKKKYILFSVTAAMLFLSFISLIAYWVIGAEAVEHCLKSGIGNFDRVKAGSVTGLIAGCVFGLVAGFTLLFYRFMDFAEQQEDLIRFPQGFCYS